MLNPETRESLERQRDRKARHAEQRTGFLEGGCLWKGRPAKVEVTFYPSESWWITPDDGDRQALTKAIWAECVKLKL